MTTMIAHTAGLAIYGAFWLRGDEDVTIKPYDSCIESPEPAMEAAYPEYIRGFKPGERDLHNLFFLANSDDAKPEGRALARHLRGYRAGQTVSVDRLASDVLRTARLASIKKELQPKASATDADWVFGKAKTSLIFLTGVEGALALLRMPGISTRDKRMLGLRLFEGVFALIPHGDIEACELDLLVDALEEKTLAEYWMRLAQPLVRNRDPRVIPFLEGRANDASLHRYFRMEARDDLARVLNPE